MRSLEAIAVGVDLNPGEKNPHVLLGDAHSIGFAPGSVEILYSNVLDHILNLDNFVEQVAGVLSGGGLFLVDLSKKAVDEYAVHDFRKEKAVFMNLLQSHFTIVSELDESQPESVWFIVAKRKVRNDGKIGSADAVLVVGDGLSAVSSKAVELREKGAFVVAMSPDVSKDKVVLACSTDISSSAFAQVVEVGSGGKACGMAVVTTPAADAGSLLLSTTTQTSPESPASGSALALTGVTTVVTDMQALMVVCHPDDEIIFGEYMLTNKQYKWTVVVVTEESEHRSKLAQQVATMNGHQLLVWKYADCSQCLPFKLGTRKSHPKTPDTNTIEKDLRVLLESQDWSIVVTDNELGTYGHPQHKELSTLLTKMVSPTKLYVFLPQIDESAHTKRNSSLWNVYAKDRPNLNMYYGKYLSYAIPVTDFSIEIRSKLLEQCVAHFPWPCAWFDCKHVSFPEGQRCGLQKNHDSSSASSTRKSSNVMADACADLNQEFSRKSIRRARWGGVFLFPKALSFYASVLDQRARDGHPVRTVCETGFASGHSSVSWLAYSEDIVVHTWDLDVGAGGKGAPGVARSYIDRRFPGRFHGHSGRLPQALCSVDQSLKCDLVFVDVHDIDMSLQLAMMAHLAAPGALVLHDGGKALYETRWKGFEATGVLSPSFKRLCSSSFPQAPKGVSAKVPKTEEMYCFAELLPSSTRFNQVCGQYSS